MYKLNIIYLKCILHNKTFTIFILVIPVLGIDSTVSCQNSFCEGKTYYM